MIYLILDTNNWIYLANGLDPLNNKYQDTLHYDLLKRLKDLQNKQQIEILVNDIIIKEWNRNKKHSLSKITNLKNKLNNEISSFKDIEKFSKSDLKEIKENYRKGIQEQIEQNELHVQEVENFIHNNCKKIEISNNIKLKIFDLSINNLAPFHNNKNNYGDAAILLSAVEYLSEIGTLEEISAFFISNNIEEYTDGKNLKVFHPELSELIGELNIEYHRIIPSALEISEKIIADMELFYKRMADFAVQQFTWDIDSRENGTMMFMEILYYDENVKIKDYLSLTIAKDKGRIRPNFISLILPSYIDSTNGVFLFFTNRKYDEENSNYQFDLENKSSLHISFDKISSETCTARFWDGYSKDKSTGLIKDVFQFMLEYDSIFVMYYNKDGSYKSISVPLFSFREQFPLIPN